MCSALATDPQGYAMHWAQTHAVQLPPPDATPHPVDVSPPRQRVSRQWSTLIRRQLRIIASDRSYALSAVLLPVIIAAMTLVIPGETGFGKPPPDSLGEPSQLLVIITVGAAFMGMSASIRELISERPIFLRERTVGLSPVVYLSAKVCVLFAMTLLQSAILISVVRLGKPGPDSSVWAASPSSAAVSPPPPQAARDRTIARDKSRANSFFIILSSNSCDPWFGVRSML